MNQCKRSDRDESMAVELRAFCKIHTHSTTDNSQAIVFEYFISFSFMFSDANVLIETEAVYNLIWLTSRKSFLAQKKINGIRYEREIHKTVVEM